ncbi:MAG: hypothetical protein H7X77_03200 [Anaerolineae bacterium]|nr:hypothetical protein [Anaerolineae bacterium]
MWRKSVYVVGLVLLLMLALPVGAQRGKEMKQAAVMVSDFQVDYTPETGLKLLLTMMQPDGCDFPLEVTQTPGDVPNVLFVDIKRPDEGNAEVVCSSEPVVTDFEVAVEPTLTEAALAGTETTEFYVVINDLFGYSLPITDTDQRIFESPAALLRQNVEINTVTAEVKDGEYVLTIKGMHLDTCLLPDITRQTIKGNTIKLEIYQLAVPGERCPQTFAPPVYNGTITLQVPEEMILAGSYVIDVNGYQFMYDFDAQAQGGVVQLIRADTLIDSAEVLVMESFPPQLMLNVKGYQPDGCNYPVQVEQTREGNTIKVHIFREMPMDIMCTMIVVSYEAAIPLGSFDPGEYTIDVNGVIVTVAL